MASVQVVDVADFIDRRQLSLFQVLVVAICFLIVAIDGFDATVMGFLASSIRTEWGLTPDATGAAVGRQPLRPAGWRDHFRPVVGQVRPQDDFIVVRRAAWGRQSGRVSLAFAANADRAALSHRPRNGRRDAKLRDSDLRVLPTEASPRARHCNVLWLRRRFRARRLRLGASGRRLWLAVAIGGGRVLPLALLPIAAWVLPEFGPRFLALRNPADPRIVPALRRIAPREAIAPALYAHAEREPAAPIGRLFAPDLAFGTLMLWSTFFVSLLTIYLLSSWLPLILQSVGASLPASFVVTSMFQVGGTLGAILLGVLMHRFNSAYVLAISYAFGGALVATIGALPYSPILFGSIVFGAGLCISGCQIGVNAVAATFYPTDCRATGVGCAHGAGRLGAIVGSMAGAAVLSTGVSLAVAFAAIAMPTLFAAASLYALGRRRAGEGRALGVWRQPQNYRTR